MENASSSIIFTARSITTEIIRLLPAYSLSRECVYRVVAQQWVYSLTHLWSRALLETLPIVQLLENFSAFYGTRRFITAMGLHVTILCEVYTVFYLGI
jgi:hypothetical protein